MRPKPLYKNSLAFVAAMLLILFGATSAFAQTSGFTYQGRLTDGGTVANGNYDFQFALWDSLSGGAQIGSTQTLSNVSVSNGVFTVTLDLGAPSFPGEDRFLEISARSTGSGAFTLLRPRQQVTSTPYAVRSANASSANTLSTSCTGCITDSQIGGVAASKLTGTIPVSAVPTGSGNYVQNATTQQSGTNFNIAGNGTAGGTLSGNVLNATSQFSIGGDRILSNAGTNNLFAGVGSGQANTSGSRNSFFGFHAGQANASGSDNTFFGFNAGLNNFGVSSLGVGISNSFFGSGAGQSNSNGRLNTFVGAGADFTTTVNANGERNTLLGASTRTNPIVVNATAIGSQAMVTQSNSLVLGSINGVNGATADTNVGIGTTAPQSRLHIVGTASLTGQAASLHLNNDLRNILLDVGTCWGIFFQTPGSQCENYALGGGFSRNVTSINAPNGDVALPGRIIFAVGNVPTGEEITQHGLFVPLRSPIGPTTQVCHD